jgi:hypothetical protein
VRVARGEDGDEDGDVVCEAGRPLEARDEAPGASFERLLEEARGILGQRGALGLLGLDHLQEPSCLVRTLQADPEPDADLVVGGLKGVRPYLLGKLGEDLGHRVMERPTVAFPSRRRGSSSGPSPLPSTEIVEGSLDVGDVAARFLPRRLAGVPQGYRLCQSALG